MTSLLETNLIQKTLLDDRFDYSKGKIKFCIEVSIVDSWFLSNLADLQLIMETDSQKVVLGKSIIVPSVSELVKESITKVRPRYVYHEQDPPTAADGEIWLQAIPVIDLHGLLHGDSMDSELERLHAACKDWGFFQVCTFGPNKAMGWT